MLSQEKQRLIGRLKHRKSRIREAQVLVEGVRAVEEALEAGGKVRFGVCSSRISGTTRGEALVGRMARAGFHVAWVDDRLLSELADTGRPQGVLLVCREPRWSLEDLSAPTGARVLVLDGVQDPGNVGTLVRAARAFALTGVASLEGTSDPWMPKAIRASAGAVFHVVTVRTTREDLVRWIGERTVPLLAADAGGEEIDGLSLPPSWALALGNEGAGLSDPLRSAADHIVSLPMPGGGDSLNVGVAGSMMMYILSRRGRVS
jgi:TrmH family RNA methyltransferase